MSPIKRSAGKSLRAKKIKTNSARSGAKGPSARKAAGKKSASKKTTKTAAKRPTATKRATTGRSSKPKRAAKVAVSKRAQAGDPSQVKKPKVDAASAPLPFEEFALDFIRARGGTIEEVGFRDYRVHLDPVLAKKARRKSARLIFDPDRAMLPRGSLFVAPGSRFGLLLLAVARGEGNVSRSRRPVDPGVNAKKVATKGFVLHGAKAKSPKLGRMRWVCQLIYHMTLTLKGGVAEQDLRSILADPRGPVFEFLDSDQRRRWHLEPGFPDAPVCWANVDVSKEVPKSEAQRLWTALMEWLNRVQSQRLERWRKRCEEARDRDLERINVFYQTRLNEEEERLRRRRDDPDEEDRESESQIKFEWSRRVRSVRARWQAEAEANLWGIEEMARPRVPVTWELETPDGTAKLTAEVDLADGVLTRQPCPVCGRLAGEFWWEGGLVCRRCRGRARRRSANAKNSDTKEAAAA